MYLPVPPQPDCASAWREAVRVVDARPDHEAYNVMIDVADPTADATRQDPRMAVVDGFLSQCDKSIETVANTIFPAGLYYRYGAPAFFDVFRDRVLAKVRRSSRWSGYYFERMIQYPVPAGEPPNQLWNIVERIRDERVRALNKFELSLFDPVRDVDNSPYGGQCLSFLSFKVVPGTPRTLILTAVYRNHFYIEKRVLGERTSVTVTPLSPEERVSEVARMIGGAEVTEAVLRHAHEMLAHTAVK